MIVRYAAYFSILAFLGCSKPAAPHDTAPSASTPTATSAEPPPTTLPSASASAASIAPSAGASAAAPASSSLFPPAGTKVTFRGAMRDGKPDTWTATITAIDDGLFQYQPHHDVANFFTKGGFRADASGIHVAGQTLEGRGPVTRVVALPFAAKASAELPAGMFSAIYTVTRKEKVTVPAGKFDAWRITVKDKLNPEGIGWVASGPGLVKIQLPTGRVDELVSIDPAK